MKLVEADVKKIIKDLANAYGKSNEDQGKMVQLLRGLAFSDDPLSNKFMKSLDKATTKISKDLLKDESVINIPIHENFQIPGTDILLEAGDTLSLELSEAMDAEKFNSAVTAFVSALESFKVRIDTAKTGDYIVRPGETMEVVLFIVNPERLDRVFDKALRTIYPAHNSTIDVMWDQDTDDEVIVISAK